MNKCSVGQVMNIHSAELGYSVEYNPDTNPPQCPGNDCAVPTDEPVRLCNGSRTCRISQEILIYPQGSPLCDLQRDGNFIRIRLTCLNGTNFFNVFSFYFVIIWIVYFNKRWIVVWLHMVSLSFNEFSVNSNFLIYSMLKQSLRTWRHSQAKAWLLEYTIKQLSSGGFKRMGSGMTNPN